MNMTTPSYIDRRGELVYQPPFVAERVGFYGFILDADKNRLQDLCDRYLNSPLRETGRFVPAGGFVLLACCNLPSLRSKTEPYCDMGSFAEREIAFWVPLIDTVKERVYWFLPYIFVDNAYAMAMGRELYGFPKSIGTISFFPDPSKPTKFALDTLVLKKYSPQSQGEILRLIEVVEAADVFTGVSGIRQDFGGFINEIVKILERLLTDVELLTRSMADLLTGKMPMVFLKEFRDVVDPVRAAYQGIVETTPFASRLFEVRFLASHYDIMVEKCDSQPICSELGLALTGPLRAKVSFYVNFDFEIAKGTLLAPAKGTGLAPRKKKLVILGGGVGSMAAAWQLTSQPNWKDIYESVTVYQIGWRLGGKCASGRGCNGRIEEHGLHVWMGFYDNSFNIMQNAYPMLDRPPGSPLATWADAFKKHSYVVIAQLYNGKWFPWSFDFPEYHTVPGKDVTTPTLWQYIQRLIDFFIKYFRSNGLKIYVERETESDEYRSAIARLAHFVETRIKGLEIGAQTLAQKLLLAIEAYVKNLSETASGPTEEDHENIIELLKELRRCIWRQLKDQMNLEIEIYRFVVIMDLAVTIVIGLLGDRVLFSPDKLDSLDNEDLREWLARHEALDEAVRCDLLRGFYDLVFAYHNGDPARPSFAAGTAIRCLFRISFSYKGAIFWKMQAGMGDSVFTPLYVALKKRGVSFKFFHRVKGLGLSADRKSIETICIGKQATVNGEQYDPFDPNINDLDCWPAKPNYSQLKEGQALQDQKIDLESFYTTWKDVDEITLHRETDFDDVVFGISLASIPYLCSELLTDPKWREMVNNVETTRTMAFQVWMNKNLAELGWNDKSPVMDAFAEPMDTWADMSQLIAREKYPPSDNIRNISYFCGPMQGGIPPPSETQTPEIALKVVTDVSQNSLKECSNAWWPHFDEGCIVDSFHRANIDPSERYVQSTKGSTQYRLVSYQNGFSNLYLVGDWTFNGLNAGCVEAATMSGKIVGNVLSGNPPLKDVWGYGELENEPTSS